MYVVPAFHSRSPWLMRIRWLKLGNTAATHLGNCRSRRSSDHRARSSTLVGGLTALKRIAESSTRAASQALLLVQQPRRRRPPGVRIGPTPPWIVTAPGAVHVEAGHGLPVAPPGVDGVSDGRSWVAVIAMPTAPQRLGRCSSEATRPHFPYSRDDHVPNFPVATLPFVGPDLGPRGGEYQ